jgi:hypothetical protein
VRVTRKIYSPGRNHGPRGGRYATSRNGRTGNAAKAFEQQHGGPEEGVDRGASLFLRGALIMNASQLLHCQQSLQSIAAHLRQLAVQAETLIQMLESETRGGDESRRKRGPTAAQRMLDPTTFTVHWGKKSCYLGNTLPYRVLNHLAQHMDHYVSHQDLLDDVWGGHRSPSAVRNVVALLRARLIQAGLEDLALAIDGSNSGHYGLLLPYQGGPAGSD